VTTRHLPGQSVNEGAESHPLDNAAHHQPQAPGGRLTLTPILSQGERGILAGQVVGGHVSTSRLSTNSSFPWVIFAIAPQSGQQRS